MQAASATVSRRLLSRLRDVMAGGGSAQDRLNKVVKLIAMDMVAEVCSCYVMRAGEVLELFATEGLHKSAVHKTRLRVGEGIVGHIAGSARPLALSDAQAHPAFAYRPETGEDIYRSMVGVPIIRGGRVMGVLAVQNRTQRHYTEEEIETLETVAMVLAELVTSGELVVAEELKPVDGLGLLPLRLEGVRLTGGIGMGLAVPHEPRVSVQRLVAENPEEELARFRDAIASMHSRLDELFSAPELDGGEHKDVLEAYRMIAEDAGWIARISEAIRTGLTAEAAVQKVNEDMRVRMSHVSDPYLRERLHDLQDLTNRLLRHLAGGSGTAAGGELPEDFILVCRSMGPTELLDYDRRKLRGVVMEEGSPTMHLTIVARALDIPVIGRVKDALARIEAYDPVILDGEHGQVFIRPSDDIQEAFANAVRVREERQAAYAALRDVPAVTRDGVAVELLLNAGLLVDLQHLEETGADGIGLYRTEIPFMARPHLPDVEAQTLLYSRVLEHAGGRPVVFRSLDVGGDKVLPYWRSSEEDNPALGWRSIRITLDCPAVLRQQLRALLRASVDRELKIMFPMIADVSELDRARALLDMEIEHERRLGRALPSAVRVGTMLEVPGLAFQLREVLRRVDFVSVGSNDLTQFLFACDRGNPRIAERYDPLSPGMLRFLRQVRIKCDEAGVEISVCGEMAGKPLEALALLGLGFRRLSMVAPAVGPVKTMIRSVDLGPVRDYLERLIDKGETDLRTPLRMFALDHDIAL